MVRSVRSATTRTKGAGRRTGGHTSARASKIGCRSCGGSAPAPPGAWEILNMRFRLCLLSFLLLPAFALGARREIVELQRDIATMQDQIRTLSSGTNEKLTTLTVLLQQTLEAANNTNKAVAVLESRVNDRLEKQTVASGQTIA